ncbi:Imm41 family immunity protein [Tepidibacter formicigenes]|jgi:hypothetical protein|uniref:Immunity protein 41 n=1 Tax=Tepidibacter formicigenes DSM 15518 TaxID=1123349 RepID=A0A1M6PSU3_9FIRM|nr:Imm41 family immunity protein [Tepidibacter formicigenes]SHK10968.1 Immunity protein 41 [Tepidibacter formicigenes DSM 15518]
MNNHVQILFNNYKGKNDSFIYYLHEKNIFNENSFIEYCKAIIKITEENFKRYNHKNIDRKISKMINYTYGYILKSFINHLNKNDLYKMSNYPVKNLYGYISILDTVINAYFAGKKLDISIDELLEDIDY